MAYLEPITRKEMYLAKAIGEYDHTTPRPITRIDAYLGKICGDWNQPLPNPITREEMYLAKIAGGYDNPTPAPITSRDFFLAAIAGDYDGNMPTPITREEIYLAALAEKTGLIVRYAEGNPLLLSDSVSAPFESLHLYGKTTQQTTTGAQLYAGGDITKTWNADDKNVNIEIFILELMNVNVFSNGTFMSFYSNADISDRVVIQLTYGIYGSNWGAYNYYTIKKGYNEIELSPYGFIEGQNRVFIQIRREKIPFTFSGTFTLSNIFVKAGKESAPYEPYTGGKPSPSPDYPQPLVNFAESGKIGVEVLGGNLFDISKRSINNNTDIGWNTSIDDDVINVSFGSNKVSGSKRVLELNFDLLPGIYTMSVSTPLTFAVRFGDYVGVPTGKVKNTIILKNRYHINHLAFDVYENSTDASFKIMLNAGATALPYEPYKPEQTATFLCPNGLPGIPVSTHGNYTDENGQQYITDEIVCNADGTGEYVQRVKEVVLDGTEKWRVKDGSCFACDLREKEPDVLDDDGIARLRSGLCDVLRVVDFYTIDNGGNGVCYIYFWRINLPNINASEGATVEQLKEYLSGNPLTVEYGALNPVRTPLTAEEIAKFKALKTYSPTTTVQNDAGALMNVGYKAKPVSMYRARRRKVQNI